jgi:hypothetical protein
MTEIERLEERIKQLIAEVRRELALSEERRVWMETWGLHTEDCWEAYRRGEHCWCGLGRLRKTDIPDD